MDKELRKKVEEKLAVICQEYYDAARNAERGKFAIFSAFTKADQIHAVYLKHYPELRGREFKVVT